MEEGGSVQAKQVQGLLCIEIKNHQKTCCVSCTFLLLWWFYWDVNASCLIQFCKCELMVVLGTSFYWSMSSVHSMKGLRKWTKLWIILYFLNTTDILQYHIVASRYPYVHFVIWDFCWREGSRYFKVFGNCSLCWSTWPSSVYLDLPQYVPPSGDSKSV